ncbi:MAG: YbbR-like domain-containing protein [Prevotella sp.]|nr:YbbR-like domain-containing protein [Prevotella sp.]
MDESRLQRACRIARNFLFKVVNKEFLIFLFFLFMSGAFWLILALNETYEREIRVPLQLVNVPKENVVTSVSDSTLRVTVRDKGYTMLPYVYGDVFKPLRVDFKTYAKASGRGTIPAADLLKLLTPKLSSSTRVTTVKPEKIEFYFNDGSFKRIPVKMLCKLSPGQSYYIAKTVVSPDSVTVYASDELLDSITYASTEQRRFDNVTDTIITTVRLRSIRGAKMVPASVTYSVYPDVLIEKSVEVPVEAINMPPGKVLRTFPARVRVLFVTGASAYRSIQPHEFSVVVDFNELANNPSEKCNIYLRAMPPNVRNAHTELQQVDYLIEQQ